MTFKGTGIPRILETMWEARHATDLAIRVNALWDTDAALDLLAVHALGLTKSRNVMFARTNDELGTVELTNGAGTDWDSGAKGRSMTLGGKEGGGVVAYVAAKGKKFVSGDVQREPIYQNLIESTQSEVALPIRDRHGRIRAVLNAESDEKDRYGDEEISILDYIAALAGLVVSRDELLRREQALFEIARAVDRAQDERQLLKQLLNITSEVLRFQTCAVFLYDEAANKFTLQAGTGFRDWPEGYGYEPGDGLTGWVCQHGQSIRLENPQGDPRWKGLLLEIPSEQVSGYLATPIIFRGRSIGAIRVLRRVSDNPHHDNRFTEDDERILSAVAEELSTGLESLRALQRVVRVERMAAWGELSAKSAHMIGNRVFALRGDVNELGHLIAEADLNREALREIQKSLVTNVTRVEEILQEFRDFVTATQLATARADLNFLVREAVDEVFPRRSQVQLIYDLTAEELEVEVDARKFRRAITEIVENSLSFFDRGSLSVVTRVADAETLKRAKLNTEIPYAAVVIEDQGPGVEPERKQLIFQPFYSSRVKGMGLGLSIVKGIIDAHGGAVMEEGRVGHGARFVMLIPLHVRPKTESE